MHLSFCIVVLFLLKIICSEWLYQRIVEHEHTDCWITLDMLLFVEHTNCLIEDLTHFSKVVVLVQGSGGATYFVYIYTLLNPLEINVAYFARIPASSISSRKIGSKEATVPVYEVFSFGFNLQCYGRHVFTGICVF